MSVLSTVRTMVAGEDTITGMVGGRVYPVELPQNTGLPALVLHLINERDGRHLLGSNRYPVARFIVDCIGSTYQAADELGDVVKSALIDYRATVGNVRVDDLGHDDLDIFDKGERGDCWRRRLAFVMRYRPFT